MTDILVFVSEYTALTIREKKRFLCLVDDELQFRFKDAMGTVTLSNHYNAKLLRILVYFWSVFVRFVLCQRFNYGIPNIPSWLVMPERYAGFPIYMPQQPIFAAGGSSDYVNSWGDYRWNNFYQQTLIQEPKNDSLYSHFSEYLEGTYTLPPVTAAPTKAPIILPITRAAGATLAATTAASATNTSGNATKAVVTPAPALLDLLQIIRGAVNRTDTANKAASSAKLAGNGTASSASSTATTTTASPLNSTTTQSVPALDAAVIVPPVPVKSPIAEALLEAANSSVAPDAVITAVTDILAGTTPAGEVGGLLEVEPHLGSNSIETDDTGLSTASNTTASSSADADLPLNLFNPSTVPPATPKVSAANSSSTAAPAAATAATKNNTSSNGTLPIDKNKVDAALQQILTALLPPQLANPLATGNANPGSAQLLSNATNSASISSSAVQTSTAVSAAPKEAASPTSAETSAATTAASTGAPVTTVVASSTAKVFTNFTDTGNKTYSNGTQTVDKNKVDAAVQQILTALLPSGLTNPLLPVNANAGSPFVLPEPVPSAENPSGFPSASPLPVVPPSGQAQSLPVGLIDTVKDQVINQTLNNRTLAENATAGNATASNTTAAGNRTAREFFSDLAGFGSALPTGFHKKAGLPRLRSQISPGKAVTQIQSSQSTHRPSTRLQSSPLTTRSATTVLPGLTRVMREQATVSSQEIWNLLGISIEPVPLPNLDLSGERNPLRKQRNRHPKGTKPMTSVSTTAIAASTTFASTTADSAAAALHARRKDLDQGLSSILIRRGICVPVNDRRQLGICVKKLEVADACEGMAIEKAKFCSSEMVCCVPVL